MDEWLAMFQAVQGLARSADGLGDGLKQAVEVARANPEVFDEPEFWDRAEVVWSQGSADAVSRWGAAGLDRIDPAHGWEFLLLDLGDCPETFRLYRPGGQSLMSERRLRDLLLAEPVVGAGDFEACFDPALPNAFSLLFGEDSSELADHNVQELGDDLLSWNKSGDDTEDFHGNNGYFLWLVCGSMALLDPLRDPDACRRVLRGRERLYVLSGFEEIFTYLATVTPEGLRFEAGPPSEPVLTEEPDSDLT